ncbi:PREDICTED: uncharacterized protein LOC109116322 [Tarenaya hassleriana]|uniref:uncharacterized protein LOC109116322 n=1 Tax=Tarenaya hassleriana TaxID=28532 RepID=UPI0008FD355A|nr:PREDICTED: uncharacterized protein LOC109116322 [Tarenaya hassleriana]
MVEKVVPPGLTREEKGKAVEEDTPKVQKQEKEPVYIPPPPKIEPYAILEQVSIYKKLNIGELKPTRMALQLADRSVKYPTGILEDVPLKIGGFYVPVDFVVLDMNEDSKKSRKNPRESRRTSKKDTVGDEIQELESPEEKIQGTDAEIPEEPQEGNPRIEDECKKTEDLTSLPPEQVDTGKLDELFTYSTRDIEKSSDSEPRLIRKSTRRRVDFDKDVSVENVESGKDVGDTSKQMEELPSVQLRQEKSKDAEIEVVADSATETEVLKSKEDDEPEVDSGAQKVESKRPKAKIAEKKGKSSDSRVIAEQRARTRSQVAAKPVVTAKNPPKKTPKKSEKRKAEPAKDMPRAKTSKISKEYQKEKMKGKRKVQEESEIPSSPSGSEDEELLASLCMSHHFVDEKSEQRFSDMKNLNTIVERNVNVSNLKEQGIWDILKILIKEFYANITKKIVKAGDPMYHRVYIRGKILHFSPAVINKFLGLKNTVVTTMDELDREIDHKELEIALTNIFYEKRKGEISPVELNFEASVLFKIARANWLPTQRSSLIHKRLAVLIYCVKKGIKINYGNMIFDHILERALNFRARIKRKKRKGKNDYKKMLETLKDAEKALIKMELGLRKQATHCQKIRATVHEYIEATLSNVFIMLETLKDAEKALIKMELGLRKQATHCQKIRATVHEYIEATLSNVFIIRSGGELEEVEGDLDSEEEDSEEEDEE